MNRPILPTQEQFAEWDSEYFDGERQNFDVMMIKAFQAGADWQLEQVIKWLFNNLHERYVDIAEQNGEVRDIRISFDIIHDLHRELRPQEDNS